MAKKQRLSDRQKQFTKAYPILMLYAQFLGYDLTDGDAFRDPRCEYGHPESAHKFRLARDFNVFKGPVYLQGKEAKKAHNVLHDFWDMLGGAPRIDADLNHYSFTHKGVR